MTLEQIIKTDKVFNQIFERAKYWEIERDRFDLGSKTTATAIEIKNEEITQMNFSYYWKQLGISWQQWQEIKE